MNNPSEYTNHSGGAYGADTFWDLIGRQFGVTDHRHYRERNNSRLSKQLNGRNIQAVIVSDKDIAKGYKELEALYNKEIPKNLQNDLKARNYMQVSNAEGVFAIGELTNKHAVKGGTNVAVQLAIKQHKILYVFNVKDFKWYQFNYEKLEFIECDTPTLIKNFAGVGTRDVENYNILKNGQWIPRPEYVGEEVEGKVLIAIKNVYTKTFEKK